MQNHIQYMRNNEATSRVGNKWLAEEDKKLMQEILENKNYEDIALEHKRTVEGIKSRMVSHIIYPKYKNDNQNIEELSIKYKINKEFIEKYINKIENKTSIKNTIYNENIIELKLTLLEKRLMILEQKLDYIINSLYNSN